MPRDIHHLTFVTDDIEGGLAALGALAGDRPVQRESIPSRGVEVARVLVGRTWIVFAVPTAAGEPRDHLDRHGPGLMLVSLRVASIDAALDEYRRQGIGPRGGRRKGLAGWLVQDLDVTLPGGATLQLCEDPSANPGPAAP